MKNVEQYVKYLMDESAPDKPIWNIEKIHNGSKPHWNYIDGCMMNSFYQLYKITGEKKYFDFFKNFVDFYLQDNGNKILGYDMELWRLDDINEGRVLFDLYAETKEEKYLNAIKLQYKHIENQPRTESNNFWHKDCYPNQVWLDGIYMAMPFYARYQNDFNKKDYNDIIAQIKNVRKNMFNDKTKLYYHGFDESRQMHWADKKTGLSQCHWLRAMGWYVVALVDLLEYMSEQIFEHHKTVRDLLKEAIDGLLQYQSESGMWYQVIDQAEREGNYLETSGSCQIAYAIMKGVRLKALPERYLESGVKCFNDVSNRYFKEENGHYELDGVCLVAGLGKTPGMKVSRDGSYEYYISEPVVKNDAKGAAAFVLAYTEYLRLDK